MLLSATLNLKRAERFAALGYDAIDVDFCSTILEGERHDPILDGDDWMKRIDAEKARLEGLGLTVNSCHLPFRYDYLDLENPENLAKHKMSCRALLAAERMGAKWAVMHVDKRSKDPDTAIENTVTYVKRLYADTGVKEITITVENSSHRELRVPMESYDRLKAEGYRVGFCLDVGHCHTNPGRYGECESVPHAIRILGDRIKMLHLHDNEGDFDMHTAPFCGTLPWEETMRALKEVGYQGVFNYEIAWSKIPDPLTASFDRFVLDSARYLIGIFENA